MRTIKPKIFIAANDKDCGSCRFLSSHRFCSLFRPAGTRGQTLEKTTKNSALRCPECLAAEEKE